MIKKNFLLVSISNLLFSIILIILGAFIIFKFDLKCELFISNVIMLLIGVNSGSISVKFPSKKLIYALVSSTFFLLAYLVISNALPFETLDLYSYIPIAINLYFGTIIGCILTLSHTKGRFKNETRKNFKH